MTAEQCQRNADYYRDLLDQVAAHLGVDVFVRTRRSGPRSRSWWMAADDLEQRPDDKEAILQGLRSLLWPERRPQKVDEEVE